MEFQSTRLHDGGVVTFEEHGDPHGVPALFLHGTPGSRHSMGWVLAPDDPLRLTARLISIDRPGCGDSSSAPRGFDSGVAAVLSVADALGLKHFNVLAVSGGCAYALLAAARHPERVERAVVLCGAVPLARVDRGSMARGGRVGQGLCRWAPGLARAAFTHSAKRARPGSATTAMPAPDALVQQSLEADSQRVAARTRDVDALIRRRAAGAVSELGSYARPWALRPDEVRVPVLAWHGRDDDAAPFAATRAFIESMPQGRLHAVDGGHLAPLLHTADAASALVAA